MMGIKIILDLTILDAYANEALSAEPWSHTKTRDLHIGVYQLHRKVHAAQNTRAVMKHREVLQLTSNKPQELPAQDSTWKCSGRTGNKETQENHIVDKNKGQKMVTQRRCPVKAIRSDCNQNVETPRAIKKVKSCTIPRAKENTLTGKANADNYEHAAGSMAVNDTTRA